ncbi:phthiocerol/phthiodiolone dimycocerosyl transferase family protein [Streptantibioticus cattleyicolor]|uniref:Phthiocerol/phthiodiolone dimycocerosyl transferase n=1 Tax=Streptantibioticus cattleyicolor (strain ATCC 35852 / DSM 46488 / JCM 4925 / NBRC 14057 / NRRL 8057) TaxID=1003195 RepID=F8JK33_STREN|nr:polyketide associated protein [Streptantibioticus cattleyicolor]AEW99832.1 acyltransferase PapA5 [Streptantibioticus cattleyicolor NRRL 8057 = DSM 46488]CCB71132.1 putative polyketide associated protein [Streptantibioticus cattleyicolor NRRL 8057 = DSM 46488]
MLQRYLDAIEERHVNAAPAHAAEYRGTVDEAALRHAFELVCVRHPVLRARVRAGERGHLLYVPPGHWPEVTVLDGDGTTLLRAVHAPWDPARAVSRLILVKGENHGFVALRVDHSVMDGHSFRAMFEQLWNLYGDLLGAADVSVPVGRSLPCPPSELLGERWHGASCAPPPESPDAAPGTSTDGPVRPVQGYIRLSGAQTERLLSVVRRRKTSVHAAVCGAVLATHRAHGAPPEGGGEPMYCLSPVNLRDRVTPPVGVTQTTMFVAVHAARVTVPFDADPLAVAHSVKEQLDTAVARRELLLSLDAGRLLKATGPASLDARLRIAQVSNNGVLHSALRDPRRVEVVRFLMPADVTSSVFPIYSVYTYRGHLSIRYLYPSTLFSRAQADRLSASVTTRLTAM